VPASGSEKLGKCAQDVVGGRMVHQGLAIVVNPVCRGKWRMCRESHRRPMLSFGSGLQRSPLKVEPRGGRSG